MGVEASAPVIETQTLASDGGCCTNCRHWRKLQPRLLSRQLQDQRFAFCREPTGRFRRSVGSTDNDDALPRLCATASIEAVAQTVLKSLLGGATVGRRRRILAVFVASSQKKRSSRS